jgi:hypothetical protein
MRSVFHISDNSARSLKTRTAINYWALQYWRRHTTDGRLTRRVFLFHMGGSITLHRTSSRNLGMPITVFVLPSSVFIARMPTRPGSRAAASPYGIGQRSRRY